MVIFLCLINSAPVIHLRPPPSSYPHGWFDKDEWNADSRSLPSPGSEMCPRTWCMKNDFLLCKFLCKFPFFGLWTDWHYKVAAHTAYYNSGMQHSRLHCSGGEIEADGSWMNTTSQTWSKFGSSGGSTDQEKKKLIPEALKQFLKTL